MIALYILAGLLLLFSAFLFIPIRLEVNTESDRYAINQPVFFGVKAIPDKDELLKIRIRIFFIWFTINPFKLSGKEKSKRKKPHQKHKSKKPMKLNSIKNMFENFKLKRLKANIDTGDFPLNAYLMPIAQQLNGKNTSIRINFQNHNSIDLLITTQLYKLASTLLIQRIKS